MLQTLIGDGWGDVSVGLRLIRTVVKAATLRYANWEVAGREAKMQLDGGERARTSPRGSVRNTLTPKLARRR
jgi:hypothetical protein